MGRGPWTREQRRAEDDRVLSEALRLAQQLVDRGYTIDRAASLTSTSWGRAHVKRTILHQEAEAPAAP